ncbi:hypothetical protein D6D15_04643 [Aureobasidium pullulans]|uniref:Pentatricopeptide repeat-containing protein-mitochondrial domain-containing protein n=1 Tax=Aureobasidium pullulans TaxID=5580 RepID=A0A4S9BB09_AURPU|nr:hypothetical protein D6D15_04643 [Aureobasidium pullulans]
MSSTTPKLVADGLWHCLCPLYSSAPLSTTRNALIRRRRPALQCAATRIPPAAAVRHNSTAPAVKFRGNVDVSPDLPRSDLPIMNAWVPLDEKKQSMPRETALRTTIRQKTTVKKADYPNLSTPELYELAHAAAAKGNSREVQWMVEYLVRDRRETPNLRLYSISILANVHPSEGSARRVAGLLQEMEEEGLQMNVQICHDVLRVLSVHMDYLLRIDILQYMRRQWLQLNNDGHHWVGAALFREGQLELGLTHLESMRRDNIPIQTWLYDIAMYSMLETNEFDEALVLVKDRIAADDWTISRNLWTHMLDRSAAAFHYSSTVYVWNSQVIPGYLIPSSGTCLNVLTTAARNGDAALATSVFHVLGKRSTTFKQIHYDQLLTTYMSTSPPDLRAAFTVLTIMASVKIPPTAVSTRPILTHLRRYPSDCTTVFDILTSLHESGRELPVAALNVLIEGYVETNQLEQALVAYKHMHLFERLPTDKSGNPTRRSRPFSTLETFNILLRGAAKPIAQQAYSLAMFLVSEMLALNIRPDYLVYDRLIVVCIQDQKLDIAYRYFDEMEELGFLPRPRTTELLAKSLAERRDDRCWDVLQRMQDRGTGVDEKGKERVEMAFFHAGGFEKEVESKEEEVKQQESK